MLNTEASSKIQDYKQIVNLVGDLPPMPAVAAKAIKLVEDPCITAKKLNDTLSADTSLTARLLKIANSAMFARQREITTLTQAIMTIGFKSLRGIIVAAAVRQLNKSSSSQQKMVWEHAVATAMGATVVATQLQRKYREEIYVLGLLHSLGQMVFLNSSKTQGKFGEVFKIIKERSVSFAVAEQEVLGFAHPLVGALVAKKWNFPEETCDVILHYEDPIASIPEHDEIKEKTAVVKLAERLAHACELGSPSGYPDQTEEVKKLMILLSMATEDNFDEMIEELKAAVRQKFEYDATAFS